MNQTLSARANLDLLEQKFDQWKSDPQSVEPTWSAFFEGFELGMAQPPRPASRISPSAGPTPGDETGQQLSENALYFRARVSNMIYAFRSLGHTAAKIDPLAASEPDDSMLQPEAFEFEPADLEGEVATGLYLDGERMKLAEMHARLRQTYCDRIGFEFMHIHNPATREWLQQRIETRVPRAPEEPARQRMVLEWLLESQLFEEFLHTRYVGQKRFSLEGGESLMVALNSLLENYPAYGGQELVMGMAHRGRLNVLANFLRKPLQVILYEFSENYVPNTVAGDGDVKYHLGFEAERATSGGDPVKIYLAANPSHLEAVNPVVEGKARARQRIIGDDIERRRVLPVLIHGDAAFAGQGMVAEVLNLSQLPGYRTGGTVHIVVNNQIGFTTQPADARSSRYCTDVAKMIEAPVFHVNADHPMEVAFVTELALAYRQEFGADVVIDMVCYRRHGHNEGDEPSFTQPRTYQAIHQHPRVGTKYKTELVESGALDAADADAIEEQLKQRLDDEHQQLRAAEAEGDFDVFKESTATPQAGYDYDFAETGVGIDRLRELGLKMTEVPEDFNLNATLKRRFLPARRKALESGEGIDWAHAEALAVATLLTEGHPVRLSGQDCRRGTFSQRHSVFYDSETRERYIPLRHLSEDQSRYCAYNSLLSEVAVLGFDYGYSLMVPEMLSMWEAQFGDFANGAQVIIDQFISSAESKWGQASGIVMLLPHGYEGQGPEHSSARLERFLQLCAEGNLQVCNCTTPAQYFHILRRQVTREIRKPLILMTPKSLLRHPQAVSGLAAMDAGTGFREVLDDEQLVAGANRVTRLVFCSGKVYYDLLEYRNSRELRNVAIIRVEQLYPFHWELLREIVARYPRANKKWVWCQEEPLNMGAWGYIWPRLQALAGHTRVRYAGRQRAASPAAGSKAVHLREQKRLVESAFSV